MPGLSIFAKTVTRGGSVVHRRVRSSRHQDTDKMAKRDPFEEVADDQTLSEPRLSTCANQ